MNRCLQLLHKSGADLWSRDKDNTVLSVAIERMNHECVQYIVKNCSSRDVTRRDRSGRNCLMMAAETSTVSLQYLLTASPKLDNQDNAGYTALMYALRSRMWDNAKLLLSKRPNVHTVATDGCTPLTLALEGWTKDNHRSALRILQLGADPTSSRGDRHHLHDMVADGHKTVVRKLLVNGFPPLDLQFPTYGSSNRWKRYFPEKPLSPLAVALLSSRPSIAKYFIANRFYTRFDIEQLSWDPEVRNCLLGLGSTGDNKDDQSESVRSQSLEILNVLSTGPQSLFTISFVVVLSILSEDFNIEIENTSRRKKAQWICPLSFREKVESLALPSIVKRELQFKTPCSSMCCLSWGDINLGERTRFEECQCVQCEGDQ